jgi:hypothetical protein
MKRKHSFCFALVIFCIFWAFAYRAGAQWLTQTVTVTNGWTAAYLFVDASRQNIIPATPGLPISPGNPIDQIWLWKVSPSTAQYITTPQSPLSGGGAWVSWALTNSENSLTALIPNAAYLIHSSGAGTYSWSIQGQPVPPQYTWDLTGLNFIGYSTPAVNPPNFQNYFAQDPAIADIVQIYAYVGGEFSTQPFNPNPAQVISPLFPYTPVNRGQAFWVGSSNVNNIYFGPFQVNLPNPSGLSYGITGQATFHLVNITPNPLTIYMSLLASETPPFGQQAIVAPPPLLLEGALNSSNLTYAYTPLSANSTATNWTLPPYGQPGSDIPVTLGVNRFAMSGTNGSLYAGILQFTDSLGFSQLNVPVSATVTDNSGLWVGTASVNAVNYDLNTPVTNSDGSMATNPDGSLMVTHNGALDSVAAPYPLRFIVFSGSNGVCSLLQRVYYGLRQNTNLVVATTQSVLDTSHLSTARRITATHLPWSATNTPWTFSGGPLTPGGTYTTTVTTQYDDQASNPFLHTYHPDHNNLDTESPPHELPMGSESYEIDRTITLSLTASTNNFLNLTTANSVLSGLYNETITLKGLGGYAKTYQTAGTLSLQRISTISTLTTQ